MKRVFFAILLAAISPGAALFAARAEVAYTARIRGLDDRALETAIRESILTFKLQNRPPATFGQLRRRIDADIPAIETRLEANGYYDGTVTTEIEPERDPVRVAFWIDSGKPYRYHRVKLRFSGPADSSLNKIQPLLRKGTRVNAADVFREEERILSLIRRRGYALPRLGKRTVTLDRDNRRVDLLMEFDPGPRSVFGGIQVEGLESVKEKTIQRQLLWKRGDLYDAQQLDDLENNLLRTGLFGMVRVVPLPATKETGAVPVHISLAEREKRTIRLGVSYSDIGPGAKVLWEHRNVFGGGEHLQTSFTGSKIERGGKISLTRPGFRRANQSLVLDLDVLHETPDAYDSKKSRTTLMVLRDFTPQIQAGLGAGYQYSRVKQLDSDERYGHLFFPLQGLFDTRDDPLNPVQGNQLFAQTAWYHDTLGNDSFLRSVGEARHYYTILEATRLSSALRLRLGSIDGASTRHVPADERFYAGGGGSIRGYEYQAVGPSEDGTPLGGSKLLEFSAELRIQPGQKLGYTLFADGGTVGNSLSTGNLRYGAGAGLRWFTAIGPLRVDLAYPLNADRTQVKRLQFYISLGQAF